LVQNTDFNRQGVRDLKKRKQGGLIRGNVIGGALGKWVQSRADWHNLAQYTPIATGHLCSKPCMQAQPNTREGSNTEEVWKWVGA